MKKHLVMLCAMGLTLCLAAGCAAQVQTEVPDSADIETVEGSEETAAPVKKPETAQPEEEAAPEESAPETAPEQEEAEDPTPAEPTEPTQPTVDESTTDPEPVADPEPVKDPEPTTDSEPPQGTEAPSQQPVENTSTATLGEVLALVGQDVNNLYAIAGTPLDSHYEYSCSGPGDDGILYYQDFIVFTYVENGLETIVDAEAA